jgi:hypothetical protein
LLSDDDNEVFLLPNCLLGKALSRFTFSVRVACVALSRRKNTLFCRGAFYFFSFCPDFTLRWKQVPNTKRLTGFWPLPKRPQITRFIPFLPPYEQPFRQKEKKSNAQWQNKEDFFGTRRISAQNCLHAANFLGWEPFL